MGREQSLIDGYYLNCYGNYSPHLIDIAKLYKDTNMGFITASIKEVSDKVRVEIFN